MPFQLDISRSHCPPSENFTKQNLKSKQFHWNVNHTVPSYILSKIFLNRSACIDFQSRL